MGDGLQKKLGIIAGDGRFPVILVKAAKVSGYSTIAIAHTGLSSLDIEKAAEKTYWIHIGEISKLINIFKKEEVSEVVMAGGISKKFLFSDVKPDLRAISLLLKIKDRNDDTILRALAKELEKEGIITNEAIAYIRSILAENGTFTKRTPTKEEWSDIEFGMKVAKDIGRLDIGQCVVVKNRAVLAVEAIEGTDEVIRRGGMFASGGAVVIKVCKPGQDTRFDLPTVGPNTINSMKEVDARVLAVEAGMTVMIDREFMIEEANRAGISIVGI